ncbi:MAG: DinB family protein [Chloroflexi bacterium]|nr:DinB family protein [Chloroflexota bacterium]
MNAQALLKAQYAQAHGIIQTAIGDCDPETLHHVGEGSTLGNIAAVYAHTVFAEDMVVNGMVRGQAPVYQAGGWAARVDVPMPQSPMQNIDWAKGVTMDLASFNEYAKAVFAATDEFIAGASDADMDRMVMNPIAGKEEPVGVVLGTLGLWHLQSHQGEIAALKGVQGKKGLPF